MVRNVFEVIILLIAHSFIAASSNSLPEDLREPEFNLLFSFSVVYGGT